MRRGTKKHFEKHKRAARELAARRLAHLNRAYRFSYRRIFIRNQRSRWGSCSERRNLSFNYKIILLPPALADYILVHELCHLEEFNHSPRFWALVERAIPDHRAHRLALRTLERGRAKS